MNNKITRIKPETSFSHAFTLDLISSNKRVGMFFEYRGKVEACEQVCSTAVPGYSLATKKIQNWPLDNYPGLPWHFLSNTTAIKKQIQNFVIPSFFLTMTAKMMFNCN